MSGLNKYGGINVKAIPAFDPSAQVLQRNFAEDILEISTLYESFNRLIQEKKFEQARKTIIENLDLISSNWQVALCLTALSHDYTATFIILELIRSRFDSFGRNAVFEFLLNLDRTVEISTMYQLGSVRDSSLEEDGFTTELEKSELTRAVIRWEIDQSIDVCILRKSKVYSYIGHC